MKHTQGPWRINNNIGRKGELGIVADDAPCIIAIMGNAEAWPEEAGANATLIAAAPKLLGVCKWINDRIAEFGNIDLIRDEEVIEQLQQAIAEVEESEQPHA